MDIKARAVHRCTHVLDLEKSLEWYEKALGLTQKREIVPDDKSWKIVYLGNDTTPFEVELTWNDGRTEPYNNGDGDTHLAFAIPDEDMEAAMEMHKEMGCFLRYNPNMGIYFIEDPDGCWIEIVPASKY